MYKRSWYFIIAETHIDVSSVIDIEGYDCVKFCRPKGKNKTRSFGGLAVLYKNELKEGISFINLFGWSYVDTSLGWIEIILCA